MTSISSITHSGKVNWGNVIGYSLVFLILPPFIGLPMVIGMMLKNKNASKTQYYTFFICIALYMGAVNATKQPSGDQINYYVAYLNVPTQGFIGSLKNIYGLDVALNGKGNENISGEFMNGLYNYFGYYLTFGYYPLFELILTATNYILVFLGFYKFCLCLKKPHWPFVGGVLILSFFYLYFCFLLQIQKQFLAQSIMMYVIGSYAFEHKMNKRLWGITVIAVFTHASTALFIPFLYFNKLRHRLDKTGLMFIGLMFVILIILGPRLASSAVSTADASPLGYGVSRLAKSEISNDGINGLSDIPLTQRCFVLLPILYVLYVRLWKKRKEINTTLVFILNILFLLVLGIFAMFRQPTAQYRYFMMLYAFLPFAFALVFDNLKKRDLFLKVFSSVMIIWFYFQFSMIVWKYAPTTDIILKSPIWMLSINYYNV